MALNHACLPIPAPALEQGTAYYNRVHAIVKQSLSEPILGAVRADLTASAPDSNSIQAGHGIFHIPVASMTGKE
jgi:hypothetical protein